MKNFQTMNPERNDASGFFMPFSPLDTLAGERRVSPRALPGEPSEASVNSLWGDDRGFCFKGDAGPYIPATPKFYFGGSRP